METVVGEQQVILGLSLVVSAFDEDIPCAPFPQSQGRRPEVIGGVDGESRKTGRLRNVRCEERRQWQQLMDETADGLLIHQPTATRGDHHGVDDDGTGGKATERRGDGIDDTAVGQHPDLHRHRRHTAQNRLQLCRHKIRGHGHGGIDAMGILCRDSRDDERGQTAQGRHRLDVRRNTGSSTTVRTGDR